jgi:hypothetical protein
MRIEEREMVFEWCQTDFQVLGAGTPAGALDYQKRFPCIVVSVDKVL